MDRLHRREADGLTHGNVRSARPGITLLEWQRILGNEDADASVAEVARFGDTRLILARVLAGSTEDHRARSVEAGNH